MSKLRYSNFELIQDVISDLKNEFNSAKVDILSVLAEIWVEVVGKQCLELSKVFEVSSDNVLIIACSDSYVANELYLRKDKLLENMLKKSLKRGIEIKDIKFDYRRWNR